MLRDFIASAGKAALTGGLDVLPNRVKWEVMSYAPTQYLNIVPVESEEEFADSGEKEVERITRLLDEYSDSFRLRDSTLLEIGVGPGRLLVPFGTRGADLYGVDISRGNLAKAESYARRHDVSPELKRSATGLPEFEESFDLIYSVLVFQHMRRRTAIQYMKDAREVLDEDGIVYFGFASLEDEDHLSYYVSDGLEKTYSFRMRYYTTTEVRLLMEELGYSDISIRDEGAQIIAIARR